jgi:DNA-binding beta-propeller fold protein YncE
MRRVAALVLVLVLCGVAVGRADKVVLVAGGGKGDDGPALEAKLASPFGIDADRSGNFWLVEYGAHRVRKLDNQGMLTTVAGTGQPGKADGPGAKAMFDHPHNLAIAPDGTVYVADTDNNTIRKIDSKTGTVSTVAGTGEKGFSGDGGPARAARFNGIYCLAFDASGEHLYLADLGNRRIRVIDLTTGTVTTMAGNGERGIPANGAEARNAPLLDPRAVAVDARGNVYVLERGGHALRVVDPAGKVRTVAGTGKAGYSGDGGPALEATFNGPKHLCIDRDGSVLIADTENHAVRKYLPSEGKVVAVAGTGKHGSGGVGGPPEKAELNQPHGVYVHSGTGVLYITDSSNHRVLKIER